MTFEEEADKELLGGAIRPNEVKIEEIKSTPIPSQIDAVLKEAVFMTPTPRLQEFVHGLTDMIPTSQPAWDTYHALYYRRPEEALHKVLLEKVSGRGAKHDEPRIARATFESLKHIPHLAHTYLTGTAVKAI